MPNTARNSVPRSPLAATPTSTNGAQPRAALVPTNTVTTGDGLTVRTRIDPTLTVDDVVKQLCVNLKIKEPSSHFALRDETDELVTNDNLRRKIKNKVNLKWVTADIRAWKINRCDLFRLVNAPAREARETAEKLSNRNDRNIKLTLFSLQKFIRVSCTFLAYTTLSYTTPYRKSNSLKNFLITMA
jgi:engulfment/cell motility protein 1